MPSDARGRAYNPSGRQTSHSPPTTAWDPAPTSVRAVHAHLRGPRVYRLRESHPRLPQIPSTDPSAAVRQQRAAQANEQTFACDSTARRHCALQPEPPPHTPCPDAQARPAQERVGEPPRPRASAPNGPCDSPNPSVRPANGQTPELLYPPRPACCMRRVSARRTRSHEGGTRDAGDMRLQSRRWV